MWELKFCSYKISCLNSYSCNFCAFYMPGNYALNSCCKVRLANLTNSCQVFLLCDILLLKFSKFFLSKNWVLGDSHVFLQQVFRRAPVKIGFLPTLLNLASFCSLLLPLSKCHTLSWYFHCSVWIKKSRQSY